MASLGDAFVDVRANTSKFKQDLDQGVTKSTQGASREMGNLSGAVKAVGAAAGVWIAGKALGAVKDFVVGSVNAASDLDESINAVNVAFADNADEINKIGENAATQLGLSQAEFNTHAVSLSAFVEQIAGDTGDVVGTLEDVTGRATDFASVMNLEVGDALQKFRSGLAGEAEPLRQYGIDVSAAKIEQVALAEGIIQTGEEMTEAQKVQARYMTIMEQTEKVAGDFANTSEGFANQQRILNSLWTDAQADIGRKLIPAFEKVQRTLINLMPVLTRVIGHVADLASGALGLADPLLALVNLIPGVTSKVDEGNSTWDTAFTILKHVTGPLIVIGEQFSILADMISGNVKPTEEYTAELAKATEAMEGGVQTSKDWLKEQANFPDAFTGTEEELANLVGTVDQYVVDAERGRFRSDEYAAALGGVQDAAEEAAPEITELEKAVEAYWADQQTAATKTDLATAAIRGNIDAQLALLDPVVGAADAIAGLNDAQARLTELQADAETPARELAEAELAVATELLGAQAAMDALDPATLEASIGTIASVLGKSKDEVILLLQQLGILDGMEVTTTVRINEITRRSTFNINDPERGQQHGGPVSANTPYLVGEAGPEIFVPSMTGRIIPNSRVPNTTTTGGNVTIAGPLVQITGDVDVGRARLAGAAAADAALRRLAQARTAS